MPYKNPEDKRRWEQEHREQRNTQRRQRRLEMQSAPFPSKRAPDPISPKEAVSGWGILIGIGVLVLGFGLTLLGVNASLPYPPAD